jgi:hypothetical protein
VLGDNDLDGRLERPGCIGARVGAGQGVSLQDDQGDDSAPGSRTALRTGVPSFETWSAVPPSHDATF